MIVAAWAVRAVLSVVYAPMRMLRRRHKVTFISRQGNSPSTDFTALVNQLSHDDPSVEITVLTYEFHTSIRRKVGYLAHVFVQMYHIATSRVVVLDTYCIPVSVLRHSPGLHVIQMWHALGSIKKFGYSIVDSGEGSDSRVASVMRMHARYDVVACSSPACVPAFAEAFDTPSERVVVAPLPRVDVLTNRAHMAQQRERLYRVFPELRDKPTVLFAPTFQKGQHFAADELHRYFAKHGYTLIAKPHPVALSGARDTTSVRYAQYSAFELLAVADFLVTDYSSIMLEAAVADVPVMILAPDVEEYSAKRSFYLDFAAEVPSPITRSFDELLEHMKTWDGDRTALRAFADRWVSYPEVGTCTEHLARMIQSHLVD